MSRMLNESTTVPHVQITVSNNRSMSNEKVVEAYSLEEFIQTWGVKGTV